MLSHIPVVFSGCWLDVTKENPVWNAVNVALDFAMSVRPLDLEVVIVLSEA